MPSPPLPPSAERISRQAPICITMGEPSGIGPEVAVAAFAALNGRVGERPLKLVGDPAVFQACGDVPEAALIESHKVAVPRQPGKADSLNTRAVVDAIDEAAALARDGAVAAVVTAPIHKASLLQGGFEHAGHTQYLAKITGADRAVMMLAGRDLRVVPLTIHIPLAEVPAQISTRAIVETGDIIVAALKRDFGISAPRLAVSGLNPHAGEEGELGTEEREIIRPAIEALRGGGAHVIGPLSADTMFHEVARAQYDAALCMYHDQALIPVKTLAFWEAVNVTLGLPIIRTSPDHGTALDIAGKGKADPRSMIAAIQLAAHMADARN
ncbi:MAG: 4-hydroxythreonine-4-phosphate dehydrogenase PdxA [Alphaproteobacteria bacterium]|nr:4-hydroxythreonine-4-phosphate dehydrogenase PdxA [Alphaproteobacteria bacterium]MBV9063268.1 4-hydroxythreonine-4-phosphate dehydrogenase PdxA [Alphaproteobacteria bacterium]